MHVCVCLMCVCLAFRVMLHGMTKVGTPLLASSLSLGHPTSFFNLKYLFEMRLQLPTLKFEGSSVHLKILLPFSLTPIPNNFVPK